MNQIFFNNDKIVLSCKFNTILISTEKDFVDVTFSSSMGILIEERFYPNAQHQVILTDLRSLVESTFVDYEESLQSFTVTASQDGEDLVSKDINVLCCRAYTEIAEPSVFLLNRFLTTAQSRRIAPDDYFHLSFVTQGKEPISYYVYARYMNSEGKSYATSFLAGNINYYSPALPTTNHITHNVREIADRVNQLVKQEVTLLHFTVRCEKRCITFFVDRSLSHSRRFLFVNAFNAIEMLTLPGVTTSKAKVERKQAEILGETSFYNVTPNKEYEMQSAGLTDDECLLCEQMFASPNVRIEGKEYGRDPDFFANTSILITDSTCEVSNGDDAINSVKFTWRYPQSSPYIDIHVPDRIHTDPFTIHYT